MRDRIIKGGATLGVRQVISLPLNALGTGIAANLLSPDDFGVLAILLVMISLSFCIVDLGTSNALVQSSLEPSSGLLQTVQRYKLLGVVICFIGYALLSPFLVAYYRLPQWTGYLFVSCCIIGWLQSQRNYLSFKLQRQLLWSKIAAIEMAEILAYNVALIGTAYFFRNPSCFVVGLAARWCAGSILMMRTKMSSQPPETDKTGSFKDLLRFGLPMQTTSILSLIQNSVNPIVVGSIAGVRAVGMINWSGYVTSLPRLPLQPFPSFLFSVISRRNREGKSDEYYIKMSIRLGVLGITFFSLLLFLMLDTLVPLFFGQKWVASIPVASILLLTNSTFIPHLILIAFLNAKGHSASRLKLSLIEAILVGIFGGGGALFFGIYGYAIGIILVGVVVLILESKVTERLTGLKVDFIYVYIIMLFATGSALLAIYAKNSIPDEHTYASLLLSLFVGLLAHGISSIFKLLETDQNRFTKRPFDDAYNKSGN